MKIKMYGVMVVCLVWIQPVMAYIDPGSGSAIMSAIIGFLVASSLAIKTYWYKLKSLFKRNKSTKNNKSSQEIESDK